MQLAEARQIAEDNAYAGANFFDRAADEDDKFINWHDKIDVDTLDVRSLRRCPVAQVCGDWGYAAWGRGVFVLLENKLHVLGLAIPENISHSLVPHYWHYLKEAWVQQIALRRSTNEDVTKRSPNPSAMNTTLAMSSHAYGS